MIILCGHAETSCSLFCTISKGIRFPASVLEKHTLPSSQGCISQRMLAEPVFRDT